ncbi:MAG TPA: DUF1559 domain-containing protein, partial [Planctomycetia bacterium]|nr:DUF1559 domain-containing protein [Planctomycetia bacterium]
GLHADDWVFVLAATSAENAAAAIAAFPKDRRATAAEKHGAVYFGSKSGWENLSNGKHGEGAETLLARVERAIPGPLAAVARLPEDQRKVFEEISPQLPAALGGGSTAALFEGLDSLQVSLVAGERPALVATIHGRDEAAAKRIDEVVAKGLAAARAMPADRMPGLPAAKAMLDSLKPKLAEGRVELAIDLADPSVLGAIKALSEKRSESVRRNVITNDLKHVALAMHNYYDVHKSFPPGATVDKAGKPLLSWRVHLLPYLEQNELYKQFKLDEPWDGGHNRKLIEKMPAVFAGFGTGKEGKTTILGIVGAGGFFPKPGAGIRIDDIKDGTSNTIMCVAAPAAQAIVWTKPDELSLGDAALLEKLGTRHVLAAFGDGSVQTIPLPASVKDFLKYLTIDGREPLAQ